MARIEDLIGEIADQRFPLAATLRRQLAATLPILLLLFGLQTSVLQKGDTVLQSSSEP